MTDEHAAMGPLMSDYLANQRRIACLDKLITDIADDLSALSAELKSESGHVEITDQLLRVGRYPNKRTNPDIDRFARILSPNPPKG